MKMVIYLNVKRQYKMNWKTEYRVIKLKESSGKYITAPQQAIDCLADTFNPISEEMYLLIMDVKNQVLEKHLVLKGGYNQLLLKPADIFRPLLMNGGGQFILAHNHPSGDHKPSEDDLIFTRKIKKAAEILGVSFLDHVIYTGDPGKFYSFKKEGLI